MTPLETAMKLASASSTCEKHKCVFAAQCKGDYATCGMKEVALIIRSQNAEIESLKALCEAYSNVLASTQKYIIDIEKINKKYHDLVIAFQHGYRPKKTVRKPYKPRKKKTAEEMDGDEKYACEPQAQHEEYPVVVI